MAELPVTFFSRKHNYKSSLDHIYYSNTLENEISYKATSHSATDHNPIMFELKEKEIKRNEQEHKVIRKRCFKGFSQKDFNNDIMAQPWENLANVNSVDEMVNIYTDLVEQILDKHAPIKVIKQYRNYQNGLSHETKRMMTARDNARKNESEEYKKLRNKVVRMVKADKRKAATRELEKNPNHLWKIFNKIVNGNDAKTIKLIEDGNMINDEKHIAKTMNDFFHDKVEKIYREIPEVTTESPTERLQKYVEGKKLHFALKPVSVNQVKEVIQNMKPTMSAGYIDLPQKIMRNAATILSIPLQTIINKSIQEGKFPTRWKVAIITPIFKKGKATFMTSYRPVSALVSSAKVLEMVVNKALLKHLELNQLLPPNQWGFRANKSCVGALMEMLARWYNNIDQKKYQIICSYDLTAMFDLIDIPILLKKLRILGANQLTIDFFLSYLLDRKHMTRVGNEVSPQTSSLRGGPQGASITATLALVMIIDINLFIEDGSLSSYCDDNTLTSAAGSIVEAIDIAQKESENIIAFFRLNKLACNIEKSEVIVIRPNRKTAKQKVTLTIDGVDVTEKETLKIVGLRISNKLDFNPQIEYLIKKTNQFNGALKRLSYKVNESALQRIANATILAKISYALIFIASPEIDGLSKNNENHKILQKLINQTARTVLHKTRLDKIPTEQLLDKAKLKDVNQMVITQMLKEVWRMENEEHHPLKSLLEQPNEKTRIGAKGFFRTVGRTNVMQRSFINPMIQLWNHYHTQLKGIPKKIIRKRTIALAKTIQKIRY